MFLRLLNAALFLYTNIFTKIYILYIFHIRKQKKNKNYFKFVNISLQYPDFLANYRKTFEVLQTWRYSFSSFYFYFIPNFSALITEAH